MVDLASYSLPLEEKSKQILNKHSTFTRNDYSYLTMQIFVLDENVRSASNYLNHI